MNIDEQIEILEAYRDGKTIEFKVDGGWGAIKPHSEGRRFDFRAHDYRIVKTGEERLIEDLDILFPPCAVVPIDQSSVGNLINNINTIKLNIKEGKYRE